MYEGDGETSWLTTLLQFVECAGPVIKCRTVNNKDTGNSRRKKKKAGYECMHAKVVNKGINDVCVYVYYVITAGCARKKMLTRVFFFFFSLNSISVIPCIPRIPILLLQQSCNIGRRRISLPIFTIKHTYLFITIDIYTKEMA